MELAETFLLFGVTHFQLASITSKTLWDTGLGCINILHVKQGQVFRQKSVGSQALKRWVVGLNVCVNTQNGINKTKPERVEKPHAQMKPFF